MLGSTTLLVALVANACGGGPPASSVPGAPTGSVQGYLFAGSGGTVVLGRSQTPPSGATPIANAALTLEDSPVDAKATVPARDGKTDANGFVTFTGVPAGLWALHVPQSGGVAATFALTVIPNATITWGAPTVSRSQALDAARKAIGSLRAEGAFVLAPQSPLPAGVSITPALGNDDGDADPSLEVKTSTVQWFFYADLASGARFQHPTKFVLVDAETGVATAKDESSWPLINGATFYASSTKNIDTPDALMRPPKRPGATPPVTRVVDPAGPRPGLLAPYGDHVPGCTKATTYSLLIQGSDEGPMEHDIANIESTFAKGTTEYLWKPSPGSHPLDEVQRLWKKIQDQATECDSVFIYITAHGTRGGVAKLETDLVSKDGTPALFQSFGARTLDFQHCRACHILIIIDACYSGKMLNDFAKILQPLPGRKATVISAADATHESGAYTWWNLKGSTGGAFTNAITDAFSGGTTDPANAFDKANVEIAGTALTEEIAKQNPQYWTRKLVPGETCVAIPTGTKNPPTTYPPTPPRGQNSPSPATNAAPLFEFVSFSATFREDLSTTAYKIAISDPLNEPLLFYWSMKASCGNISVAQQHSDQNGYFHGGCDVNTVERAAVLTVRIVRAADVTDQATGAVKPGAGYATFVRSARAQDSTDTASWPLNQAFVNDFQK